MRPKFCHTYFDGYPEDVQVQEVRRVEDAQERISKIVEGLGKLKRDDSIPLPQTNYDYLTALYSAKNVAIKNQDKDLLNAINLILVDISFITKDNADTDSANIALNGFNFQNKHVSGYSDEIVKIVNKINQSEEMDDSNEDYEV